MSAAEHKDEGTKHFKAKEYAEAARSYTRAIELESDPVELAKRQFLALTSEAVPQYNHSSDGGRGVDMAVDSVQASSGVTGSSAETASPAKR